MSVHAHWLRCGRFAAILVCVVAGAIGLAAQAQAATFGIGTSSGDLVAGGGTLSVANPLLAPATVNPSNPAEGQPVTIDVTSACQVTNTPTDHPTITWGDGAVTDGTTNGIDISGTHTYAEEGNYTATVTWSQNCLPIRGADTSPQSFTINVSDDLSATVSQVNATVGTPFSGQVATFTDDDTNLTDYTALINWGDGQPLSMGTIRPGSGPGQFVVTGSHTYTAPPALWITVIITDNGGTPNQHFSKSATAPPNVTTVPAPTVTGITPSSGPATGGTQVTITGANFTGATGVSFGTSAAASFKTNGDTSITATAPPGTGKVDVTVATPSGTSPTSASDLFSYVPSGSSASGGGGGAGGAGAGAAAAPSLTPGAPAVVSTTSAAFTATVNPEGLATSVAFDYGPELAAAKDVGFGPALRNSAVTYTATTPAQPVGPDFSSHQVSATVTGLLPNTTYDVRVVATNSAGLTLGPNQTLTTPADPAPGPPVLGQSFDAAPVSGLVLVRLPHGGLLYSRDVGAHALLTGNGFVPLTEARQLPSGTQIDARLGAIKLVTATTQRHKTQTGTFSTGLFGLSQSRRGVNKGLTTLSLLEGLFAGAPSFSSCTAKKASDRSYAHAAGLSSAVLQTLRSSAHGHFRTRGRYSAATVRGTIWTTTDRCDGTLTSVQKDTVAVTDFVRHKTILLHAGQHYLAKPRK